MAYYEVIKVIKEDNFVIEVVKQKDIIKDKKPLCYKIAELLYREYMKEKNNN